MKKTAMILLGTALISSVATAADWTDNVKVKGDLRYRYETIHEQGSPARERNRLRARIGIQGKVSDMTKVYIGLASGSSDPVSTNQTLTGSFSTKSFSLDLAYLQMHNANFPGFTLTLGKMKNPFLKPGASELIWDSDINPEGGALAFEKALNENVTFGAVGSGLWIEERSKTKDSWMAGGTAQMDVKLSDKQTNFGFGGGFFSYANVKGYPTFYEDDNSFGNSAVESGGVMYYGTDFEVMELFGQATHRFDDMPVTVYGDYANNTAADSNETAWIVGGSIGHAKAPGSWELRYKYRDVKGDAVLGLFSDSDFRGGGTNAKGHEMGGELVVAKNTYLGATYFINTIDPDSTSKQDFNRLQLDLQLKF